MKVLSDELGTKKNLLLSWLLILYNPDTWCRKRSGRPQQKSHKKSHESSDHYPGTPTCAGWRHGRGPTQEFPKQFLNFAILTWWFHDLTLQIPRPRNETNLGGEIFGKFNPAIVKFIVFLSASRCKCSKAAAAARPCREGGRYPVASTLAWYLHTCEAVVQVRNTRTKHKSLV